MRSGKSGYSNWIDAINAFCGSWRLDPKLKHSHDPAWIGRGKAQVCLGDEGAGSAFPFSTKLEKVARRSRVG
jgi:hypothetical protein